MAFEFRCQRRIEFADTDMAGIVHFANFFRFMEEAEHAFLRSLGLSVFANIDGEVVSWPRVRAECSYRTPIAFEEMLEIHLLVREKTRKSITYNFRFYKEDSTVVALGLLTVVCVAFDPATQKMSAISIPQVIDEKIEAVPASAPGQ